jgi:hypothetical protein
MIASACASDSSAPAGTSTTTVAAPSTVPTSTTTMATTTTTIAPTTTTTVPPPEGLVALVEGHNDLTADRINLIFAPWGWEDLNDYRSVAVLFLGWDQRAQLFDDSGRPATDPALATGAELGLFGFEPFRSNRDKFNVWITEQSPPGPALWLNTDEVPFGLPDQSIVTLALDPDREVPGIYSVAGQDVAFSLQQTPVRSGSDSVANAMVFVRSGYPAGTMIDLPHELGHALFSLADEYVGRVGGDSGSARPDVWPSCAASRETGEAWWGDLAGEYDPMIDVWAEELEAAGFGDRVGEIDFWRDQVRTDFIEGGCWGDPGSFRSAEDTLMGFNLPAFGLTNRRSAERILALWEG